MGLGTAAVRFVSSKIAARSAAMFVTKNGPKAASFGATLLEAALSFEQMELDEMEEEIASIFSEGASEALETMASLVGNEGQESVFINTIIPTFFQSIQDSDIQEGWITMTTEYDEFVGGIVEEGNAIMDQAFERMKEIADDMDISELAPAAIAADVGLWWAGDELRFGINPWAPGMTLTPNQKLSAGGVQGLDGKWVFPANSYAKVSGGAYIQK